MKLRKGKTVLFMTLLLSLALFLTSCGTADTEAENKQQEPQAEEENASEEAETEEETETKEEADLENKIVIACVGDSITFGINGSGREEKNYPVVLQELLGDEYAVLNYGFPGATLQDEGSDPYSAREEYQESLDSAAQTYIIMLGTNDSTEENWDAARYEQELKAMVDTYLAVGEEVQVYLMTPPQAYIVEGNDKVLYNVRADVVNDEIYPIVTKTAEEKGIGLIDLNQFTVDHADWFADGVHPNADGYAEIAQYIYQAVNPDY